MSSPNMEHPECVAQQVSQATARSGSGTKGGSSPRTQDSDPKACYPSPWASPDCGAGTALYTAGPRCTLG